MAEKQLECDNCGASRGRRECEYCGTVYYNGPEIPDIAFNQYDVISGQAQMMSYQNTAASMVSMFPVKIGWNYGNAG